eukprot:m.159589 g.159589  ORF g.159589 m.159589 type:complete len:351 (-) comp16349_c1_seq4:455-1507(-)
MRDDADEDGGEEVDQRTSEVAASQATRTAAQQLRKKQKTNKQRHVEAEQEKKQRELQCQYSSATIDRVLMTCSYFLSRDHTRRLELLLLQEIVAQGRLFEAVEYAGEEPHLIAYLEKRGITPHKAAEEYQYALVEIENKCVKLPADAQVYWVDSIASLQSMRGSIEALVTERQLHGSSNPVLVGIDTEWRNPRLECTVMQIAVDEQIWILDTMIPEEASAYRLEVARMLEYLLTSHSFQILGFAFKDDIRHILPLCPVLREKGLAFTDVQALLKKHLQRKAQPSLSLACQIALGQPLNKLEQCSNWERRPLRPDQLNYAAIDAWCLTKIYSFLILCKSSSAPGQKQKHVV